MSDEVRTGSLQNLGREIRKINASNGWNLTTRANWDADYKVPAILAMIHYEVSEALESYRHNDIPGFLEELADVLIRTLDCAVAFTADFDCVVEAKLAKNRKRDYRHGGKRV